MTLHIAVVLTKDLSSLHADAHHASWIGFDRHAVVQTALRQCQEWNRTRPSRGYYVAVGVITDRATEPVNYSLEPLALDEEIHAEALARSLE